MARALLYITTRGAADSASAELGRDISEKVARTWAQERDLARVGGRYLFSADDYLTFLSELSSDEEEGYEDCEECDGAGEDELEEEA